MNIKNNNITKYAFIDRDGTLIKETSDERIDSIEKLVFVPGVIDGLSKLIKEGYSLIMVTNQYDLDTPIFPMERFIKPHFLPLDKLRKEKINFEAVFICPHEENSACECQKPKTGLFDQSFLEKVKNSKSIVIGDRDTDLQFAENLGINGHKIDEDKGWSDLIPHITG